jgi:DNA polymerase V
MKKDRTYIAIDLKSFYASVECVQRGLDPLNTNLVVADVSRTEKTICLAVSPSLKSFGIPGRPRLFEVNEKLKEINNTRKWNSKNHKLTGKSIFLSELNKNLFLEVDYIAATPQMSKYMMVSTSIYDIYLKYIAPEDIHVYSIDEVFIDATDYLSLYNLSARDFTIKLISEVLTNTGVTATAGIGTNMYLCKIAMDIVAKHIPADEQGVRIAELDEMSYRRKLWNHRPLTDFWRVGKGYANKLESRGIYTMGDVARCSLNNEDLLYKLFGVNAELLIDHAWGRETTTIADIQAYKPENNSISSGQVLKKPYEFEKARLIVKEMTDSLVLELVDKHLVCNQLVLTVCYDISSLKDYKGEIETDRYGRKAPKQAHGSENLDKYTSSTKQIVNAALSLYDKIVDKELYVRRIYIVANHVINENDINDFQPYEQLNLFTDYKSTEEKEKSDEIEENKEKNIQHALLDIKKKYGKNAILKGMNLEEDATAIERNSQVGGHKA